MGLLQKLTLRERTHLCEWHELEKTPLLLRVLLTDTLQFFWCSFPWRKNSTAVKLAPLLLEVLNETNSKDIFDMCSGSGGPHPVVAENLASNGVSVTLTDLYPHLKEWEALSKKTENLKFISQSIDATKVPRNLFPQRCVRTFMGCFHHFTPELAQNMFQDAIDCKHSVVIVEGTHRSFFTIFVQGFLMILITILFAPFIGTPGTVLRRILLTYIFPIFAIMFAWDNIVSNLRSYRKNELMDLTQKCQGSDRYNWEWRVVKPIKYLPFLAIFVFIGKPKN